MDDDRRPFGGKVAVVTGGVAGIGRSIATMLAERGAKVAVVDLDVDDARSAASELPGDGHLGLSADVADSGEVDAALAQVLDVYGRLDVMVNNAGSARRGVPTDSFTDAEWRATLGPIQDGVFYGMRAAGRIMLQQGGGAIVNIASIRTFMPKEGLIAYAAGKGAVGMMTRVAALEWGPGGVRVNAVAPGITRTPNIEAAAASGQVDLDAVESRVPLRSLARPEDIAESVCYLASDAASYVTGTLLVVDGGLTLVPGG